MTTISLDTSVVLPRSDEREMREVASLIRRIRAGDFKASICTHVDWQIKKALADADIADVVEHAEREMPVGRWGGDDRFPPATYGNFVWASDPEPRPHASAGSRIDDDIVEAHQRTRREHLVTYDLGQLRRARQMGLSALTPAELLALYPAT